MTATGLMKDKLDRQAVRHIGKVFCLAWPAFDNTSFQQNCLAGLESLALKQRVQHIIKALHLCLPDDFAETAPILRQAMQHWLHVTPSRQGWTSFAAWPVIDYVAAYGLDHPHLALPLLKELTPLFSAEFAVRPFLLAYPELCFHHLLSWCDDQDEHVRRLASEGSRPRLPWGLRLQGLCKNPAPLLPLLEKLKNDPSAYVRKSVANNLNDIAKDHADITLGICKSWQTQASPETLWIIRHALRSLVKQGHPQALAVLGFTANPAISLQDMQVSKHRVTADTALEFSFSIHSRASQPQQLVVDYAIHHRRANGATSAKVFKLKSFTLPAAECMQLKKSHSFKPVSTRRYYPGTHRLEIFINGSRSYLADFELVI